jgi:hypothetical protein
MPIEKTKKAKRKITKIRRSSRIKTKGVDTSKYCGTVKFDEDALAIQKRLRNEWE